MPTTWAANVAVIRTKIDAHVARSDATAHPREVDNIVDLIAASAHLLGWTVQVGAFTETEARRLIDQTWQVLLNVVDDKRNR